jgi:uncharacterized RDD family membrane protein YckC
LSKPIDTTFEIETPEGIDLLLRPAGMVPRALAFAVDLAVRGLLLAVLVFAFSLLGQLGLGLMALLFFAVNWLYMVLFEVLDQGRSPGKRLLGLKVIHDDGTPIGWPASLIRNLLRVVDMLPFGYSFGALSCLWHPAFKRLGDLAAGTLVIHRDAAPSRPELPQAPALQPCCALTLEEQRAVVEFALRADRLSAGRRAELARIVAEPLRLDPTNAETQLLGIARALVGMA